MAAFEENFFQVNALYKVTLTPHLRPPWSDHTENEYTGLLLSIPNTGVRGPPSLRKTIYNLSDLSQLDRGEVVAIVLRSNKDERIEVFYLTGMPADGEYIKSIERIPIGGGRGRRRKRKTNKNKSKRYKKRSILSRKYKY